MKAGFESKSAKLSACSSWGLSTHCNPFVLLVTIAQSPTFVKWDAPDGTRTHDHQPHKGRRLLTLAKEQGVCEHPDYKVEFLEDTEFHYDCGGFRVFKKK